MKGLFFKIFISFWLSTIAIIIVSYWIGSTFFLHSRFNKQADELLDHYLAIVDDDLKQNSLKQLKRRLKQSHLPKGLGIVITDEEDKVVFIHHLPRNLVNFYQENQHWPRLKGKHRLRIKERQINYQSKTYLLSAIWLPAKRLKIKNKGDWQHWPSHLFKQTPLWSVIRILSALLISALICFILARYITKPILRLKDRVHDLSKGVFISNVAEEFTARNDEITELAREFDSMADELQRQFSNKQTLFRDISHELRSPLARLGVAVELLRTKNNNHDSKEIKRIEIEISRLDQLIEQILQLSKFNNELDKLELEKTEILSLIKSTVDDASYEMLNNEKSISFINTITPPLYLNVDRMLIHRAIENVIRNAIIHTPDNSKVSVKLSQLDESITIIIHDQGHGVDDEELEKIFLPFYRVSQARERQSGGSGLGLAISKQIIEAHGGKIKANNEAGLKISIFMPLIDTSFK